MQLDRTRIAVRERGFMDVMDLALQVIRHHAGPLFITSLIGVIPFALLNAWILHREITLAIGFTNDLPSGRFWYLYGVLIVLETPLATALTTLYLGQALFLERPSPRRLLHDYFASLPQMLLLQGLLRAVWAFPVVLWFIPYSLRPYLSEIILLERNPLLGGSRGVPTTGLRSAGLHGRNSADFLGRWLISALLGAVLVVGLYAAFGYLAQLLFNRAETDIWSWHVDFAAAVWLVTCFFAVVRFLSYLDLRIRNEGWEIELRMRAEAERLTRQLAANA